jgi:hypothetical protein
MAVGALALVPAAFAGKGGGKGGHTGGGGGGTISMVLADDTNGNGVANYGEKVTFTVATTATTNPQVNLKCYQNGVVVLNGSAGFGADDPWAWAQIFTLSTAAWTGGAANCTATLSYYNGRGFTTLATTGFPVAA